MGNTIQTEVDSLVSLVKAEGRISVKDAAKRLGVPAATISEWAAFLEEESIINIEYKFTTPYLVKKQMDAAQAAQARENLKEKKDLFERKSDSMLTYLNKLEIEVESLKKMFGDAGSHFKKSVSDSKKEFKKLQDVEKTQEELNKKVLDSKKEFLKEVTELNKNLLKEQENYKAIFDFIYSQSQIEGQIIEIQSNELSLIKTADKIIDRKLKEIKSSFGKKEKIISKKKKSLSSETESNIKKLEKKYVQLRDFVENQKGMMGDLVEQNKEQEEEIEKLRKEVIVKIQASNLKLDKTLSDATGVPKKLKSMMNKKKQVMKILNGISDNENILKEKLNELMDRASSLRLTEDPKKVERELNELGEGLNDVTKKKGFFEKEVKKIFDILKFK